MRVFLDTNVLVAALATRGLCADVVRLVLTEHELIVGEVVIAEVRRALRRKLRVSETQAKAVERFLREHEVIQKPAERPQVSVRDEDDLWILASALAGQADVLVTGDRDLLDLGSEAPIPVLDPRAFWNRVRKPPR